MNWTPALDASLAQAFLKDEKSYGQIAASWSVELGERITVGMIAGRCNRLKLKRGGRIRSGPVKGSKHAVTLDKLEPQMCKWPVSDTKPFRFCAKARTGKAYCAKHEALSIRTHGKRRKVG